MNGETREGVVAVLRNLAGELRAQTFDESDTRDPVSPNYRVGWNDRTRSIAKRIDIMISQLRSAGPFAVVRATDDFTLSTWETLGAAASACRNSVHEGVNCYVARDLSRSDTGYPLFKGDGTMKLIGRDGKVWP